MLEDAITSRKITKLPYEDDFDARCARLTHPERDAIVAALEKKLAEIPVGKAISASWIPGSDWTGTVFMPIYTKACGRDFETAALFFGKLFQWTVIHHASLWRSIKQPKSKNDPDGVETSLYWRAD